ncbi:MAG: MAPEG family protein [Alphaproteobacteria bacterium]
MPIELSYLVASILLFGVMIAVQAVFSDKEHGLKASGGARDGLVDKNIMTQRAKRANANMIEGLILFAPLIFVAAYADRFNGMTALGAALFFWSRVAYAPLYWFGVPMVRSLAWFVGIGGTVLVALQVLPFS